MHSVTRPIRFPLWRLQGCSARRAATKPAGTGGGALQVVNLARRSSEIVFLLFWAMGGTSDFHFLCTLAEGGTGRSDLLFSRATGGTSEFHFLCTLAEGGTGRSDFRLPDPAGK